MHYIYYAYRYEILFPVLDLYTFIVNQLSANLSWAMQASTHINQELHLKLHVYVHYINNIHACNEAVRHHVTICEKGSDGHIHVAAYIWHYRGPYHLAVIMQVVHQLI